MDFDVIVIGTGQAGVPLAARLPRAGKRVLIAERGVPGGTCVNSGCTPTKTMIASARAAHVARTAGRLGIHAGEIRVDFPAVVARKDEIVRQWRESVEARLGQNPDRLVFRHGHARFVGAHEVELAGERFRAETIIIDVGARPVVPPISGLETVHWLDNRTVMELRALPAHLVVLGGGYVGCELGQMFRRFGSEVTIIDRNARLLAQAPEEISAALETVFRNEGVSLELSSWVERVAPDREGIDVALKAGKHVRGSHLLVATGRRPNTDDLGSEAAGLRLDERGFVMIDDRYGTNLPGVYAVGDASGEPQFTHVSWDDHRILFDLLVGRSNRGRGGRHIPYAVFTDPQIAGVGLMSREAHARGIRYERATMPFGQIARAVETDETAGTMEVLIDPDSERILGATLMGAEAGELIHVIAALMEAGATARAIVDAEFVHPTYAEGVQSLVMRLARYALS